MDIIASCQSGRTPHLQPENPWTEVKPKSFAKIASSPPQKPRVTAPQPKYDNVPVGKFMAPMPKTPVRRTGSFGKRYLLRLPNNAKPTRNTALPVQVIVSEVNRACSGFNIKANSAEWTMGMNIMLYFSYDSLDGQITKAGSTILGVLARNAPKATFMKSEKWSRIVVRNFPSETWIPRAPLDGEDPAYGPFGEFRPVDRANIESALRAAHPLLADATFMEGPDWTSREGPRPGDGYANVSFAIPDPNEERTKVLTRRPLMIFGEPCHCTQWVEKVKLVQCTRCWKFGSKVHPNCPVRCRRCGGTHDESTHNVDCRKCETSDMNQEDRKAGRTTCSHPLSCPNCSEAHAANDQSCRMRNHAACEERQRKKIGRGQTFIDSFTEGTIAPRNTETPRRIDTPSLPADVTMGGIDDSPSR